MFSNVFALTDPGKRPKGLTAQEIKQLSQRSADHFGCPLPEGYCAFLRASNGFSYDGYRIFCLFNGDMQREFPYFSTLDFESFNTDFSENTDIFDFLLLGKSSIDYFVYHKKNKVYQILSNGALDIIFESADFATVLTQFFRL